MFCMFKNKRGRFDLFMKSKLLQIKIFDNRLFTFCYIKEFVNFLEINCPNVSVQLLLFYYAYWNL